MGRKDRIIPGALVAWRDKSHVVLHLSGLDRAVVRCVESGDTQQVQTSELIPYGSAAQHRQDLMVVPDQDWHEALRRYQMIEPLLAGGAHRRGRSEEVAQIAQEAGVNRATLYRWLARYEETGLVSSLLRPRREDYGKTRLKPEVEQLLGEIINSYYLSRQKVSLSELCLEVDRRFREVGLDAPHPNTIRARVALIPDATLMAKRVSHKAARERFAPIKGSFPNADTPLAVVQIDHTPVDLMLVDDVHRLPIGRPFLTLAIDVFSRMVAGFYIGLEAPGAMSVGLCIADAVLEKDTKLASLGIAASWPMWGKMAKIHVDNAREFRGTMLERACAEHGIVLEHRPKGQPNFGGHIERAFRTFMQKAHTVPGTTFSNTRDKGEYNSDARASMTLSEFEKWFTTFIVKVYHHTPHKGLGGRVPIKLYEEAIMGTNDMPGIGMPLRISDEYKFRLDFTPFVERTIQEYGVLIDGIHYYSDILRPYIHARDSNNSKLKRKFLFARDPRNISTIYFLDPDTRAYVPVGYRDTRHPAISIWELNAALKRLAGADVSQPNEEMIFEGVRKMRELEAEAAGKTKSARQERRKAQKRRTTLAPASMPQPPLSQAPQGFTAADDYPDGDIAAFNDVVESK